MKSIKTYEGFLDFLKIKKPNILKSKADEILSKYLNKNFNIDGINFSLTGSKIRVKNTIFGPKYNSYRLSCSDSLIGRGNMLIEPDRIEEVEDYIKTAVKLKHESIKLESDINEIFNDSFLQLLDDELGYKVYIDRKCGWSNIKSTDTEVLLTFTEPENSVPAFAISILKDGKNMTKWISEIVIPILSDKMKYHTDLQIYYCPTNYIIYKK